MSTSTEKLATAAPVKASFKLTTTTVGTAECTMKMFENLGRVSISWDLPFPYLISGRQADPGMEIVLLARDARDPREKKERARKQFVERTGTWDTNEVWGSGWSAELKGWDWADNSWTTQMITPATEEKP